MKLEEKEVPLSNLGVTVNPDRLGMFNAVCDNHMVEYDHNMDDGVYTITLTEESILEDLYKNISFALIPIPGQTPDHSSLHRELSTLDVD
jgi:hypothetical protein